MLLDGCDTNFGQILGSVDMLLEISARKSDNIIIPVVIKAWRLLIHQIQSTHFVFVPRQAVADWIASHASKLSIRDVH